MDKTIVDLVEGDSYLQSVLQELVKEKYLLPGIFHPNAYLIDDGRIEGQWKNRRNKTLSRAPLIAIGVTIYNQLFREVLARAMSGEDPQPEPETSTWLKAWQKHVTSQFPDDPRIDSIAAALGQYLEYMNRKSQEF